MVKKLLVVLAAACACFSCSPPPFDLAISLSTLLAKSMTLEGAVGPVDKLSGDTAPQDASFMPEYTTQGGLDLQNGFVLYTQTGGRQLGFVTGSAAQGTYHLLSGSSFLGPSTGGIYPDVIMHVPQDPVLLRIEGFTFDPANPYNTAYGELRADIPGEQVVFTYSTQPGSNLPPLFGITGKVIGVSIPPSTSAADPAFLLAQVDGTGNLFEFSMSMAPSTLTFLSPTRGSAPYDLTWLGLPGTIDRVQYFYDSATQRSYLSTYDAPPGQDTWRCWWWSDVTAGHGGELTGVDHRIDALLSTGELFSTQDDTGRVYGSDGTLLAEFPLAGLTFIDERIIGGVAKLIFSQSLSYNGQQRFNIYSIPTANVKTLAAK